MTRDAQREQDFYEKYGITNGSGGLDKAIPKDAIYRITFDSETKKLWLIFIERKNFNKLNVIAEIDVPGMCYAESVKEFKTKGDSSGGWEEVTEHRVFILLEMGQRKCPWCGNVEEFDGYNDPHYLADHRAGECPKCKRHAFVTHDHINGVCQKIPPESLANFKSVGR